MSDLNETVLPAVWSLARKALLEATAPSVDALIASLTPQALIKRTGADRPSSRHVGPSVRALVALRMISTGADGSVALTDPSNDEAQFRLEITRRLLAIGEDRDPWEIREGTSRLEHHLEMSVAWLHVL